MSEPLRERLGTLALVAALAGFLLGLGVGVTAHSPGTQNLGPSSTTANLVPPGARGVLLADVARLRSLPALRRFFFEPQRSDPCELRLARRVRSATVVFQETDLSDLAVALDGELERDELGVCVRSRAGGLRLELVRAVGMEFVLARREDDPALVPVREEFSAALLAGGTVVAGANSMVLRISEHARAGGTAPGAAPLRVLRERLSRPDAALTFAALLPQRLRDGGPAGALLQHVRGVAAALTTLPNGGVEVVAVLACDDFDAPRPLTDALERLREDVGSRLQLGGFSAPLRSARVERGAAEVRVQVRFSAAETEALTLVLGGVLRSLEAEPASAQTPDAG